MLLVEWAFDILIGMLIKQSDLLSSFRINQLLI